MKKLNLSKFIILALLLTCNFSLAHDGEFAEPVVGGDFFTPTIAPGISYIDNSDGLGSCSNPIDYNPIGDLFSGDFGSIVEQVQGCAPKMEDSIVSNDNFAAYCSCVRSTHENLNHGQITHNEAAMKNMKEAYYSFIGLGWKNKIASEITLLKELHNKDTQIAGEQLNISCNIEKDPALIAQNILDQMNCAITTDQQKDVQERLRLFLKDAITPEHQSECKTGSPSLKDEIACYMDKIQKEKEKNYSDDFEEKCFTAKEMQIASAQPSYDDLEALFSVVYQEDVSDRLVDTSNDPGKGINGDIKKSQTIGLPDHIDVFKKFDPSVLKSIMHISHSTVDNFIDGASVNKATIEQVKKVKELLVRNPKLYALLSNPATKENILNDLFKKAKLSKLRDELSMRENLTPKQKENLKEANKLLLVHNENYRKNGLYNSMISSQIQRSCEAGDITNPSFERAFSNILCTKPEELKLPPRYFISRINPFMKDYDKNENYCGKPEVSTEESGFDNISRALASIESKTCYDPKYEIAFCEERATAPTDLILDDDGNNAESREKKLAIENFISNVHKYLIDDNKLLKDSNDKKMGSPLLYKAMACKSMNESFCKVLKEQSGCYDKLKEDGADLGEISAGRTSFRDCRTKFINDNYQKLMSVDENDLNGYGVKLDAQTRAILSQQYTQAQVCKNENGTTAGCVNENGTSDVEVKLNEDQIAYINSSGSTTQQNSTTNQTNNDILPSDHYSQTLVSSTSGASTENYVGMSDEGLIRNRNHDFYKNKFNNESRSISAASTQPEMVSAVEDKIEDTKTNIEQSKRKVSDLESKVRNASNDSEKESFQKKLEQESKYLASQESILKELQSMKEALDDMKEENTSLKEQIANSYNQINNPGSAANSYNNPTNYQPSSGVQNADKATSGGGSDVGSVGGDSGTRAIVSAGGLESASGNSYQGQEDGGKGSVAGELSLNVQNLEQIVSSPTIKVGTIDGFKPNPKELKEIYNKDLGDVISVLDESTNVIHLYKLIDGEYVKTHEATLVNGRYVYTPIAKKGGKVERAIASEEEEKPVKRSVTREGLLDNLAQ